MQLALFDFDGTITRKDSLGDFIQFAVGRNAYYAGLFKLSPILAAYLFKLVSNHFAKERLFSCFFKDWEADYFREIGDRYSLERVNGIVRPEAINMIEYHRLRGHEIVVVSASIEQWLKKWCELKRLELISTRAEVINGRLTGKFATRNCYGIEKVNRIKKRYDLATYSYIYAYGDSRGDREMLGIAHKKYYNFKEISM